MNEVKKASNLDEINELGLSKRIYNIVKDVDPERLIYLVRNKDAVEGIGTSPLASLRGIKGVGKKLFAELEQAIDQAGYIRHDFDRRSLGIDALCRIVDVNCSVGNAIVYTPLKTQSGVFSSNEVYEEFQNFSEQQISDVIALIDDQLDSETAKAVKYWFNLGDEAPTTDSENLYRKGIRKLRHPNQPFRTSLKAIVCIGSEKECNRILQTIMGELASIHNHPILQKWRELNEGLSQISQLAPYESAHGITEFFEKSFNSPVGVIGPDNFDVVNYRKASINTVGDFVMFCFANPKDWFGKVGHFKTLQEIREIVDKIEKLGVLLPLSNELRSDKLTTKLKESGLKPETLEALKRVYHYQCECVGDVIMGLYYKPEKWFEYNYRSKPDIGCEEALELLNMITSLGFKIPPTDNIVVPDEKGELPPTLEELNLREETKQALEKSGINSMAKFLIAYTNYPKSWYKRLRLGEGAVEIMMKMAAMGYLEVFNDKPF